MNEQLFLKGQRVVTPDGEGEVIEAIGNNITVKLDRGDQQIYPSGELQDDSDAG